MFVVFPQKRQTVDIAFVLNVRGFNKQACNTDICKTHFDIELIFKKKLILIKDIYMVQIGRGYY